MNRDLNELERRCGYTFRDKNLFHRALTHSSYANEHKKDKAVCNERLEFLGDAVLEVVSSDFLYHKYPEKPEGELSKIRASLVCEPTLAYCAAEIWSWAAICFWERARRPPAEESVIPWFPMLWRP